MKNFNELTDERLVSLYIDGNDDAFDILLKRYETKLFTYIVYAVRNQELAEDLFQDAFVRIITTLRQRKYVENGKFSSWVMRIVHNLIIDHYRHSQNANVISNDSVETDMFNNLNLADEDNAERQMIDVQTMKDVKKLIHLLPENQREVVLMRYYKELSFKEIAEAMGVSINTALGRMRYALINLRRLADEHGVNLAG
jgi:RNA polymerase sigma-70 factor (ECF subfamily)